ncbi:DUF1622 domain-containing protein [Okeania sp.]|uniref:DUF1622 domain-containing protein n=1 Tax=Okeania sp. TaxID=3100323 RepID=UPI0035C913A2
MIVFDNKYPRSYRVSGFACVSCILIISPNWNNISNLSAIAGIRTFLNFFLEKEIEELEEKNKSDE